MQYSTEDAFITVRYLQIIARLLHLCLSHMQHTHTLTHIHTSKQRNPTPVSLSQAWLPNTREHAGLLQGRSKVQVGRQIKRATLNHDTQCCILLVKNKWRECRLECNNNINQNTKYSVLEIYKHIKHTGNLSFCTEKKGTFISAQSCVLCARHEGL